MAISDEILRLQSAKAALKTAINAKNDSSHQIDDETLEDYAGFVDLIHDALPAAYTELEYIGSDGTQYIDTGISGSRNLTFVVKYKYSTFVNYGAIYGNYTADSAKGYRAILGASDNGGIIVAIRSSFSAGAVGSLNTKNTWHILEARTDGSYYIDGTLVGNVSPSSTGINSGNIALFNRSLSNPNTTRNIGLQISDFKVLENNTTIQHLIPAKRNSDNAIGMYDKVSGTFFTNSGTGEFIAPSGSGGGSATLVTKTITENGTYDAEDDSADGYSEVTVNVQPPQEAQSKDVNFYDYDGKILYSYTASEFAQLTEMPANPTHDGWTSKGWNWTLANAKTQVTATGKCDIGQMYRVTDGKTRLYCHFSNETKSPLLTLYPKGTVTIDWGDGSATDTLTGTSRGTAKNVQHTYATSGHYVITLSISSGGSFAIGGSNSGSYLLRKGSTTTVYLNMANSACLEKIELGEGAYLGNYAFCYCCNLKTILISDNVGSSIGTYLFYYCYSLKHATIPTQITTTTTYMFRNCYSLKSVCIPKEVTTLATSTFNSACTLMRVVMPPNITTFGGASMLYGAYSLKELVLPTSLTAIPTTTTYRNYSLTKLVVPATVTSIATKAFQDCYGMKEYHFKSTTPPTLDNADAFSNMQSDCVIYVPSAKLNDYKTASNWSTYASQMVGE